MTGQKVDAQGKHRIVDYPIHDGSFSNGITQARLEEEDNKTMDN